MRCEVTMTELLYILKASKQKMDEALRTTMSTDAQYLLTLYNPNKRVTIKNIDINSYTENVKSRYCKITNTLDYFMVLNLIKDEVNATNSILVPKPIIISNNITNFDINEEVYLKVSEVVFYHSDKIKSYYDQLLKKLKWDYESACHVENKYKDDHLSIGQINGYVEGRLSALRETNVNDDLYKKFSEEYIKANQQIIFDPLQIKETSEKLEEWISNFYNKSRCRLAEFNATTRIWYDLEKFVANEDYWGYVE